MGFIEDVAFNRGGPHAVAMAAFMLAASLCVVVIP